MKIRNDLAKVMPDGLPRAQRQHALRVMQQSTVDKLSQKRSQHRPGTTSPTRSPSHAPFRSRNSLPHPDPDDDDDGQAQLT